MSTAKDATYTSIASIALFMRHLNTHTFWRSANAASADIRAALLFGGTVTVPGTHVTLHAERPRLGALTGTLWKERQVIRYKDGMQTHNC